jgi:hypothetical protein
MAIKVVWGEGGPYAIADTVAEALELIKSGSNNGSAKAAAIREQPVHGTLFDGSIGTEEERVIKVFSEINDRAKAFLSGLSRHPSGIKGGAFAQELKTESSAFGGILGGMAKIAKKYDFSIDDFVLSELRIQGAERFRFLKPEKLLVKYADKMKG